MDKKVAIEASPGDIFVLSWATSTFALQLEEMISANDQEHPNSPGTFMSAHYAIAWADKSEHIDRAYRTHGRVTLHDGGTISFNRAATIYSRVPAGSDMLPVISRIKGENTPTQAMIVSDRGDTCAEVPASMTAIVAPQLPSITTYMAPGGLGVFSDSLKPTPLVSHVSLASNTLDQFDVGGVIVSGQCLVPVPCTCAGITGANTTKRSATSSHLMVKWHYGPHPI